MARPESGKVRISDKVTITVKRGPYNFTFLTIERAKAEGVVDQYILSLERRQVEELIRLLEETTR